MFTRFFLSFFFTLTGIFFDILVICCVAREKTKQNINLKKLKKEKNVEKSRKNEKSEKKEGKIEKNRKK